VSKVRRDVCWGRPIDSRKHKLPKDYTGGGGEDLYTVARRLRNDDDGRPVGDVVVTPSSKGG